ncbi:MAG: hypothetical protein CME36_00060 [unclassified Hahellaceae]|nr:hypothetical protein [Hahellaceae bacterium]
MFQCAIMLDTTHNEELSMTAPTPTEVAEHLIKISRTVNEEKKLYLKKCGIAEHEINQDSLAQHPELVSIRKPIIDALDALTQVQVDQVHAMAIFGRSGSATQQGSLKDLYDYFNDEKKSNSRADYRRLLKAKASNLGYYLENCLDLCEEIPTDPCEELR